MVNINLLPYRDSINDSRLKKHIIATVITTLVAAGGCGATHFVMCKKISNKEKIIDVLRIKVHAHDKELAEIEEFKALKKEIDARIEVIDRLRTKRFEHIQTFDSISRNKPKFLWIDKLTKNSSKIALEGVALNEQTVASFLAALGKDPDLKDVELKFTEKIQEQKYELRKFKITLKVKRELQ